MTLIKLEAGEVNVKFKFFFHDINSIKGGVDQVLGTSIWVQALNGSFRGRCWVLGSLIQA